MQRVLVLADPLAILDDLLEQPDQLAASVRPAREETDALADAVPCRGHDLLTQRDDPAALYVDLHFLAAVAKAFVDQERLRCRRGDEPSHELPRKHALGGHAE